MIKCKVVEKFDLKDFDKLKNIKRKSADVKGTLYVDDEFECDEEMAKYLTGDNALNKAVVKIIEVEPDIKLTHRDIIEENIIPLENEEKLEELKEEIEKHIEKPKKKKKSKK